MKASQNGFNDRPESQIDFLLADQKRGATSLYCDALLYFSALQDADLLTRLPRDAARLAAHFNVMGLFRRLDEDVKRLSTPAEMRNYLDNSLRRINRNRLLLARNCVRELPRGVRILTISSSSLVESVLSAAHPGKLRQVICLRSGPVNEGEQFAEALGEKGIPVSCIEDERIREGVIASDMILSGCDLWTSAFFINKSGTLQLSDLAVEYQKPMWITADHLRQVAEFSVNEKINPNFEIIPFKKGLRLFSESGCVFPGKTA